MSLNTWLPETVERTAWRFPNADEDPDGVGWLSPSQVKEYYSCPRCYEANRVLHLPKRTPIHFAVGTFTHKAAEHVGRAILANLELTPALFKEAEDAGNDAFETDISKAEDVDFAAYETRDTAKDVAARTTRFAIPIIADLYVKRGLVAVELDLERLPAEMRAFPFPMHGRMDALFVGADAVQTITDLKTASKQAPPTIENRIQGAIYRAHWAAAGYDCRVGFDVIAKTKAPSLESYWMTDEPDSNRVVVDMVIDIAERINRGDFPIGQGWNGRHDFFHNLPEMSRAATWV